MPAPLIRPAMLADLPVINEIYNHCVLHSTCTYQVEPETMEGRGKWFVAHGHKHPVIVLEDGGAVVAWGSLSRYHARAAYSATVENSVYVHHDFHRRGFGRALLAELIRLARLAGHHTIIAAIDAEQAASVALHREFGFVEAGRLAQLGWKFNRWLDVIYMQLLLT
jgi:phosphinothricin acetyltransferase